MGYVIDYQADTAAKKAKNRKRPAAKSTVMLLILLTVLSGFLLPNGKYFLHRILFPGNTAETISALEDMAENLKAGMPFSDAFSSFCFQVISE